MRHVTALDHVEHSLQARPVHALAGQARICDPDNLAEVMQRRIRPELVALVRFGLAGSTPRYHDYIPWRINPVHATAHPLRMLRLLGRRGENNFLNQREMDMLDSWLKQMKDKGFIVGYDPNDSRGFHYINKKYKDHKDTIQIRRAVLHI